MKEKPWLDAAILSSVFARVDVNSDDDAVDHFACDGLTVSRRAIGDARKKFGIPAPSKSKLFQVEQDQLPSKANRDEVWELVFKLQQELRKENYSTCDANIKLTSNEPIGVFFMGDLHIGDIGTDHQALLRDVKLIEQTEGLYGTFGGDYLNNFIKGGKKIKNHEVVPVEFAWMLAEDLMERLQDSLWMILLGNHDEWTDQAADIDKLGEIVRKLGVPYGKYGANVNITFPDQQRYKIRLRHKYRFESSLNLLNAVKQMYRHDEPFDIGVLHHLHQPGLEMFMQNPTGQVWAVRPGSYKVEDDFSAALGYSNNSFGKSKSFGTENSCKYSIPVAILYPGERKIQFAATIQDGIDMLSYAREAHKKGNG